jgi:hypothetical protein
MFMEEIDWKTAFAVLAILASLFSQVFYIRGVLRKETKPHSYTWLIWTITLGVAAAGLLEGGANALVAAGLSLGALGVFIIFLLSFKYGTKNITRSDTVLLLSSFAAIYVWLQLDQPILAVLMVSLIDGVGYIPTYRKSWNEPWSEDIPAWATITLSYAFSVLALDAYNLLTVPYLATIMTANIILLILLWYRRKRIQKPNIQ